MNRISPPRSAQHVRSSEEIPIAVADELRRYDDHLRDVRGLAAGTRHNRCRIVEQLLSKKFTAGVINMAALRPVDIRRFMARQLEGSPSHSAAAQVATALRSYLRYRTVCGDSVAGLNAAISSPVQWKLASLPRALKPHEVRRLLGALPSGRWHRRGYAIIRCALDMGLRAGEIA
ncbi:MAG: integrase, partial [Sedimenticolaceae bacterium]